MPKSRTRKRHAPAHRPPTVKLELVRQRAVATMIDDLDDLMRAVPAAYDAHDQDAAVRHHAACTAVVAHLRRHDLPGMLARLAGGEMMIVPEEGTPTQGADNSQNGNYSGPDSSEVLTGERVCACPARPVRHLPGCPEAPLMGQPSAIEALPAPALPAPALPAPPAVAEVTPDADPLVWMAVWRAGIPYHSLRADGMTTCGRSTRTGEIMAESWAASRHRQRCARCYPVVLNGAEWVAAPPVPFDRRVPGAQLPHVPEAGEASRFDTSDATLERIAAGLRRSPVLGAIAAAVPCTDPTEPPEPTLYSGDLATCRLCGPGRAPVRVRKNGTLYAHGRGRSCTG